MAAPTPAQNSAGRGQRGAASPLRPHPNPPIGLGAAPRGVCEGREEEEEGKEEEGPFLPPQPQNLQPPSALSTGNLGCYRAGGRAQRMQGGCAVDTLTWTWTQRGDQGPPWEPHVSTGPLDPHWISRHTMGAGIRYGLPDPSMGSMGPRVPMGSAGACGTHNSPCCCLEHQWGTMLSLGPLEIPQDPLLTMGPTQSHGFLCCLYDPELSMGPLSTHGMLCYQ